MRLSGFILPLAVVLMSGCVKRQELAAFRVGMTKKDVVACLGKPDKVWVQGESEYFIYEFRKAVGWHSARWFEFTNNIMRNFSSAGPGSPLPSLFIMSEAHPKASRPWHYSMAEKNQ